MMTVGQPEDYFKCWCSITKQIESSNLPVLFHSKIILPSLDKYRFHYKEKYVRSLTVKSTGKFDG